MRAHRWSSYSKPEWEMSKLMFGQSRAVNVPAGRQRLVQLLPNASFAEVPGAGGFVQHTAPAQCVEFWRAFVARSRPAPAANLR